MSPGRPLHLAIIIGGLKVLYRWTRWPGILWRTAKYEVANER